MSYYLRDIIELRKDFAEAYKTKRYADAIEYGNKIIDIYKENNDCDSEAYADDINNLAILYDEVRINEKAIELYKEAAELKEDLLGDDSESYLETIENLGILYSVTGSFDKAEELLKRVKNHTEEADGPLSERHVKSLYNLGNMYADKGMYKESAEYLEKALEYAKKIRNYSVSDMEDIRVSLGNLYKKSGNYKRALDEYERALKISEERNEEESYFKMTFLLSYALLCQKCELYDKAAEIYEKAVESREKLMDTGHLDFISVLNNLAAIYNRSKKTEKAVETHKRVLSVVEDILGKDHVFYGDVITNLGVDYSVAGDYEKALKYHNEALEIKKQIVGEKHIHYVLTLVSLADVYEKMEKYDRALEIQNKALEIRRELFGEINEQVSDSLVNLGRISLKKGEITKAQGFFMQALIMNKEIIVAAGLKVRGYGENIRLMAEACAEAGELDKTEQFCSNLAEYRKSEYGDSHPKYAAALYDGGAILMKKGYYAQAEKYLEKAAEITELKMGMETPFCQRSLYAYGKTLYENKKYSKAADVLKKAGSVWKKYSDDTDTLVKIMFLQAKTQYMLGFPQKAAEVTLRAGGIASRNSKDGYADLMTEEMTDYARIMIKGGDSKKAFDELEKISSVAEGSKKEIQREYLRTSAEAAYGAGNYAAASERAKKVYADDDNADKAEKAADGILTAKALTALKRFEESDEILSDIKEILSEDNDLYIKFAAETYCLSGVNQFSRGKFEEADSDFTKGLEEAKARENLPVSEYTAYLKMAAQAAEKTNALVKAIENLSECALIIRRDSGEGKEFADILYKAAGLYCVQERYEDAVTMYDKAAAIYSQFYGEKSEQYVDTLYESCLSLFKAKKYAETAERIEKLQPVEYRKNEFNSLLSDSYKASKAVGKLIKLKFGGKK